MIHCLSLRLLPLLGSLLLLLTTVPASGALVVSELMYHAPDTGAIAGDSLDYIEFYNNGSASLDLSFVSFGEGLQYTFPAGTSLAAGEYLLLVASTADFAIKYPAITPFDQYAGQLRNAGERLVMVDGSDTLINFRYNDNLPWPVLADGNGWSIVPVSTSLANTSSSADWRLSAARCGSPGEADGTPPVWPAILVNEVLTHTDPPDYDAIELYNASNQSVDIGGWWISDDRNNPKKFQIPNGTTLAAGGYYTVDENDFGVGANGFVFNRVGDWAFVFSANANGNLTGYSHGWDYGAQYNGVSFGIHTNSQGDVHFVAQENTTLGSANSAPRVGPLIMTRIMYHPASGTMEFVGIKNVGDSAINMWNPYFTDTTWRTSGFGGFEFPIFTSIEPGEEMYLTTWNPESFRSNQGLAGDVQIFQYTGSLNNNGEELSLSGPDLNPDTQATITVPFVMVDWVEYNDVAPWPVTPDGGGDYLQRVSDDAYGNDPQSWQAASGLVQVADYQLRKPVIYPNPAQTQVTIYTHETINGRLEVYDMAGKQVHQQAVSGITHQLQRGSLPAGVYCYRLIAAQTVQSGRVVFQD